MAFPLDRILTISADDYSKMIDMPLRTYVASGVQCQYHAERSKGTIHEEFAKVVPEEAEVVVGYKTEISVIEKFGQFCKFL